LTELCCEWVCGVFGVVADLVGDGSREDFLDRVVVTMLEGTLRLALPTLLCVADICESLLTGEVPLRVLDVFVWRSPVFSLIESFTIDPSLLSAGATDGGTMLLDISIPNRGLKEQRRGWILAATDGLSIPAANGGSR
jgi:hypothetical protein